MSVGVISGATISCSFGAGTGNLNVTSQTTVLLEGKPVATIQDAAAMVNVSPCGMCTTLSNPQVASATSAALGVLTPQPCVPSPMGIWQPVKAACLVGGIPCLCNDSTLLCSYGGTLRIISPGQGTVIIT